MVPGLILRAVFCSGLAHLFRPAKRADEVNPLGPVGEISAGGKKLRKSSKTGTSARFAVIIMVNYPGRRKSWPRAGPGRAWTRRRDATSGVPAGWKLPKIRPRVIVNQSPNCKPCSNWMNFGPASTVSLSLAPMSSRPSVLPVFIFATKNRRSAFATQPSTISALTAGPTG